MGGEVSYPLIVDGRVFVIVCSTSCALEARDKLTGEQLWGPIDLGSTYWGPATLAYDGGRLFTSVAGLLQAWDAATGAWNWTAEGYGRSAPVASNGLVYWTAYGGLAAFDEATGALVWTAAVNNLGGESWPLLSSDGVYLTTTYQQAYDFDPADGGLIWHHPTGSTGGLGSTPVLYDGVLYARDFENIKYNGATGAVLGSFAADPMPAFDDGRGFFVDHGVMRAVDTSTGRVLWTFTGDGRLATAPVVSNGFVYVASPAGTTPFMGTQYGDAPGTVFGIDVATGAAVWHDIVPFVPYWDWNLAMPAIGEGVLAVPFGTKLIVYS